MTDLPFPILIIVLPLISAFLIILMGWLRRDLCYPLMILILFVTLLSSIFLLREVLGKGKIHYHLGGWPPPWGIEYVIDPLNGFVLLIVSAISLLIGITSKPMVEREFPEKAAYFYCLFLLQVTGLLGIVITGDLFNLYVFLEIASIAGYALIAIGEEGAPFASFNYMIYGTIGACFYLLGVGYLYIATGSLNMADLTRLLPNLLSSKVILIAFAFFSVGIAIKMALFPLHVWLPDAYTYAPSAVSALLAPLTTKVGAYIMIRVLINIFPPSFFMETLPAAWTLRWVAGLAILFGCALALAQKDLKRMLGYVLIAEIGYIALGLGLGNRNGLTGAILHIMNDGLMMACLFLFVGAITLKGWPRKIDQLRGLHRKMPFTSAAFVLSGLSVIGIPPMCGFFSKWYLVLGAIEARQWLSVAILLASSLCNAILFFRITEKAYFDAEGKKDREEDPGIGMEEAPLVILIPLWMLTMGVMAVGLLSGKIISGIIRIAIPGSF